MITTASICLYRCHFLTLAFSLYLYYHVLHIHQFIGPEVRAMRQKTKNTMCCMQIKQKGREGETYWYFNLTVLILLEMAGRHCMIWAIQKLYFGRLGFHISMWFWSGAILTIKVFKGETTGWSFFLSMLRTKSTSQIEYFGLGLSLNASFRSLEIKGCCPTTHSTFSWTEEITENDRHSRSLLLKLFI